MTNTKEKSRKHGCDKCSKLFITKTDLNKHKLIHSGEKPFKCNNCEKKFRQVGSLKNHYVVHHPFETNKLESYACTYCNKTFKIKDRLKLHLRVHTGEKPYICSICNMAFARGGQLIVHSRTHSGERPFKCEICNVQFTNSANLKVHLKRHINLRDQICDICGKSFLRPDALKKHLACYHNDVRAFLCKICNKQLKGHLPQHMRLHQKEKPFGCAVCLNRFAQRSQLTVHQRIHSGEKPYRCQVCWKAFAHSSVLKLHIHCHTGVKPFKCLICTNVAFAQLPHLKKHMFRKHNTDKPYYCTNCKSFFRLKNDLEKHQKNCFDDSSKDFVKKKMDKVEPPMSIEKMRLKLAILLKKISTQKRLKELGFNKRLIDDILLDSIKSSGRQACLDPNLSDAERLRTNVQILLEWTVPKSVMESFKSQRKSTEELLEELTS